MTLQPGSAQKHLVDVVAEAGTSAEVQGAPEAVDAAIELEASPEASEGSTTTQLAALERELELEESASGFSTASLPQPSGLDQPVAASGSQLPTTADATATEAGPVEVLPGSAHYSIFTPHWP